MGCFLNAYEKGQLDGPTMLVVHEAGLVDVISMRHVCAFLPSHVGLVLVGDPHQLVPVGPCFVLRAMVGNLGVPVIEHDTVKRYGGARAASR